MDRARFRCPAEAAAGCFDVDDPVRAHHRGHRGGDDGQMFLGNAGDDGRRGGLWPGLWLSSCLACRDSTQTMPRMTTATSIEMTITMP